MTVIITAEQTRPGDVLGDRDGNLWMRNDGRHGQVFHLLRTIDPQGLLRSFGYDDVQFADIDTMEVNGAPLTLMIRDGQPVGDTLPEPEPPRTIVFTWYLHGGKPYEEREQWERQLGIKLTDELLDKIGQPFYEVELACVLDTQTGKVEIQGAK
jgi:hypothetical protein